MAAANGPDTAGTKIQDLEQEVQRLEASIAQQRTGKVPTDAATSSSVKRRFKVMAAEAEQFWKKLRPYLEALKPYLEKAKPYLKELWLFSERIFQELKAKVFPHLTEEVQQIIFATVLLFFGGRFAMTIACAQSFKTFGWRTMKSSWEQLQESHVEAMETLAKDGEVKELFSLTGIEDLSVWKVGQVVKEMLMAETEAEKTKSWKRMVVLMKCVDPNKIMDALKGFWVGIVSVIANLRFRLAYCVSIGSNIGKRACDILRRYLQDKLYAMFPDHKKWIDFGLRGGCGLLGILASLVLTRLVSAVGSAMQGATLLAKVIARHLKELKQEKDVDVQKRSTLGHIVFSSPTLQSGSEKLSRHEMVTMWSLVACGLLFQLRNGYRLPLPFKIVLAPLVFTERSLSMLAVY